jgi:autotransporter-associated beta strand protein
MLQPLSLAGAVCLILACGSARADTITVTGGTTATIPGAYASGTHGSITVSGTGSAGERSTLVIDEATSLTAESFLSVTGGGLLSMRANVTATFGTYPYSSGTVSGGGTLELVSGTLTAERLAVSGSDALRRSGGSYALGTLEIAAGANASFLAGDRIANQRAGGFAVNPGGTLTLETTVSSSNGYYVSLTDSTSRLVRATGSEALERVWLNVDQGAAVDLIPGDRLLGLTVTGSGVVTLAPGATSLRIDDYLYYGSGGRIVGLESVPYDIAYIDVVDGQRLDYRGGAIDDQIRGVLYVTDSGTVSLHKNLTLPFNTIPGMAGSGFLAIAGAESRLEQNGHTVATRDLGLTSAATHTADADFSATRADISDGSRFQVAAGRWTVSGTAYVSGTSSVASDPVTGGSCDIGTLVLREASTASINPLTDRVHNLSLGTATRFTTLPTAGGLTLDTLELTGTTTETRLVLGGFAIDNNGGAWGLRMNSHFNGWLQTLLSRGTIVSGAGQTLSVVDVGGYAYVISGTTRPIPPPPPTTLITITVASGTQTQGQAGYADLSGAVSLLKRGAGTLVITARNTMTGSTAIQEGTLRSEGDGLSASTIVPLAGGTLSIAQDWCSVDGLEPLAGGVVDVGRGLLHVRAGLSEADARAAILTGRGDGSWQGVAGITSSTVAAEQALGLPRAIGWTIPGGDELLVGYAALGDANLDWSVDISDVADIIGYGKYDTGLPAGWYEGDFNYDGVVDMIDLAISMSTGLYDTGFYRPLPVFQHSGPVAAVPEPTAPLAASVLLAAVVWAATRRS